MGRGNQVQILSELVTVRGEPDFRNAIADVNREKAKFRYRSSSQETCLYPGKMKLPDKGDILWNDSQEKWDGLCLFLREESF